MPNHHFISYSAVDAEKFAIRLYNELLAGPPSIPVWLDKRKLKPGLDWDKSILEAIRSCDSMIFIMTPDSVSSLSVCQQEWSRALAYKKPVIPLLRQTDVETPFRLGTRQHIDFTGNFDTALAQLRVHLDWLVSPEGELHGLEYRLADANRDFQRAEDTKKARVLDDIQQLEKQIEKQRRIVNDPGGEARRVQNSIDLGIERERQPERPTAGAVMTRFINPPPGTVPTYFQNRHVEIKLIGKFIKDDAIRLITVVGRAGIGKTAMVCRLLKSLESGNLPDDGGPLPVDGIIYLSETGSRKVNMPNLFSDLCRLLPDDKAGELNALYKDPRTPTSEKIETLMAAFPRGNVLLMLDNFEDSLDPKTRNIKNEELDEALKTILKAPHHAVKIILTTRVAPFELAVVHPERQQRIDLDKGLKSPYAENILREMDAGGKLGLKTAPDAILNLARERTRGNPRALEALFAILSADRDTALKEILNEAEVLLPENVVHTLVGEAYNRLDSSAQMVMQALAVYARPVSFAATDFLLQPYLPGVDCAPLLNLLVNMQFVRKESGRYYLHPVDRAYALSRVPEGELSDRKAEKDTPYTQIALLHRGANYFKETRKPRKDWKTIDDLAPQLAEFDLRCEGQDFDTAASVLGKIDFDYLDLWGYYRLKVELYKRLEGKLVDPFLKQASVGRLGLAYEGLGQYQEAIVFYNKALDIARDMKSRQGEGVWLGNLGNCYIHLGETSRAIDYYEQALKIDREIGDRKGEGIDFGNLGICYSNLGQTSRAIEYYEQALVIDREVGNRRGEGTWLGNLGASYADLGQTSRAIEYYEQALEIDREVGYREGERIRLGNLGIRYADLGQIDRAMESYDASLIIAQEIGDRRGESFCHKSSGDALTDQGKFNEAIQRYNQAIKISDEISLAQNQNEARSGLALALLYVGDLPGASTTIGEARQYNYPPNNHWVLSVLGITALRQQDVKTAQGAFTSALSEAETLLKHSKENYKALDSKGMALCGLALCEKNAKHVSGAKEAFRAAREINSDVGYVGGITRVFDELKKADGEGMLETVNPSGKEKG